MRVQLEEEADRGLKSCLNYQDRLKLWGCYKPAYGKALLNVWVSTWFKCLPLCMVVQVSLKDGFAERAAVNINSTRVGVIRSRDVPWCKCKAKLERQLETKSQRCKCTWALSRRLFRALKLCLAFLSCHQIVRLCWLCWLAASPP